MHIVRFTKSDAGGVALLFGLLIVPLLMAAGAAVDFMRKHDMRANLQEAADAAALAAARNVDLTDAELDALVSKIIAANYGLAGNVIGANVTRTDNAESVTVSITGEMATSFLKAAGVSTLALDVVSEAALAKTKEVEVALVLDYSSSMTEEYPEMRDAAMALLDSLEADTTGADFEAAVIPFAKYVYGTFPSEYIIGEAGGGSWTNCTLGRQWPHVVTDDEPNASAASRWGSTDGDAAIGASEYDECAPYAAQSFGVMPLNPDLEAACDFIAALTPVSGTNIALGTEIGWSVLSPNNSWGEADDFGPGVNKHIIILTDGRQNEEGHGPGGEWSDEQAIANFVAECEDMRDQGIGVFTIAYEIEDPEGKDELLDCAGAPARYFEAGEDSIDDVFAQIYGAIKVQPHLVK
jgi:Flp pilus assembly protein TadG